MKTKREVENTSNKKFKKHDCLLEGIDKDHQFLHKKDDVSEWTEKEFEQFYLSVHSKI